MSTKSLASSLKEAIKTTNKEHLASLFEHSHPADIADIVSTFSIAKITELFALLALEKQVSLYSYLSQNLQTILASTLKSKSFVAIFAAMHSDKQADLFVILPQQIRATLLETLSKEEQKTLSELVAYSENEVGSIMTTSFIPLHPAMSVDDALMTIKKLAKRSEILYESYVADHERRLIGKIELKDILIAEPKKAISEIMHESPASLNVHDDKERASQLIAKYDALSIPVVDDENRILGIVTHDDALDVANESASEDFLKLSATEPTGLLEGIKETAITTLFKKRVYWLLILVFGSIFSGAGIAYFEETIAAYISLLFFLPLLIGSAGNAGSQSATLTVRALATGEIVIADWRRMILKELAVASLLGLSMGAAVSLLGLFRGGLEVAFVVALTMQIVVIAGSLIGLLLPFLLTKFKLDPATASGPLVTSIADATGVLIYFTIARALLPL